MAAEYCEGGGTRASDLIPLSHEHRRTKSYSVKTSWRMQPARPLPCPPGLISARRSSDQHRHFFTLFSGSYFFFGASRQEGTPCPRRTLVSKRLRASNARLRSASAQSCLVSSPRFLSPCHCLFHLLSTFFGTLLRLLEMSLKLKLSLATAVIDRHLILFVCMSIPPFCVVWPCDTSAWLGWLQSIASSSPSASLPQS